MHKIAILVLLLTLITASLVFAQGDDSTLDLPISSDVTYIIEAGDTLDELAALFDVSLACLRETNGLSASDTIRPGDVLLISVDCPAYNGLSAVEFPREDAPGLDGSDGTYVIQAGDTLDTIAQEFDISLVSLQLANEIADNAMGRIMPGQVLSIPADAPPYGEFPATDINSSAGGGVGGGVEGDLYIVQPGDTLDVIAQEYNISLVSLKMVNEIENGRSLQPGQTLVIPGGAPEYGQFPATDIDTSAGGGVGGGVEGELYVMQPGDTLDVIAQERNVSVISLLMVNEIENAKLIQPGTTILIPEGAPAYGEFPAMDIDTSAGGGVGGGVDGDLYVIQPRDTIDQIAADFNAATACIVEANEISNVRLITPGTTVIIPSGCPAYTGFAIPRTSASSTTTGSADSDSDDDSDAAG